MIQNMITSSRNLTTTPIFIHPSIHFFPSLYPRLCLVWSLSQLSGGERSSIARQHIDRQPFTLTTPILPPNKKVNKPIAKTPICAGTPFFRALSLSAPPDFGASFIFCLNYKLDALRQVAESDLSLALPTGGALPNCRQPSRVSRP